MFETWKLLAGAGGMRLGDDFKGKNIKIENKNARNKINSPPKTAQYWAELQDSNL